MIVRLTLVLALPFLGTAPVLGQTAPAEPPTLPSAEITAPAPSYGDLQPGAGVLPSVVPALSVSDTQQAPQQMIGDEAARDARIAAMRARFEDLRRRDLQLQALGAPSAPETLAEVMRLDEQIALTEAELPLMMWKAENLRILASALSERPEGALPVHVGPGIAPDIALAVIRAQTTLYAAPQTDAASVMRTLETVTTMLRVAEIGPFTLVWSPQDRFAYVLSQFREVY